MNLICTRCKKGKPETDFHKDANSSSGRRSACKTCMKMVHATCYAINKKRHKANGKAYREANKEKVAVYKKAYHLANKERVNTWAKVYYQANEEKLKKANSNYAKSHRDKHNAYSRKRKALKRGVHHEFYSDSYVFERDCWVCQLCGQKINRRLKYPNPRSKSIDHIVPLSKGGDDSPANVQATHLRCNLSKQARAGGQLRLMG